MTELSTQSITMDNLPASQLEYHIKNYNGDIYELGIALFKAGNKTKHGFVAVVKRIEEEALTRGEKPTEARENYLQRVFGKGQSTGRYYLWENAYKVIEGLSDDVKETAFRHGEAFGVTNLQTINTINNARVKSGDDPLTSEQVERIMEEVVEKNLNTSEANQFMKGEYLPKQDSDDLDGSPADFNDKIQFDDGKPTLETVKFKDYDLTVICEWFNIDELPNDPMERGDVIYRAIQQVMLINQSAGK